MKQLLLLLLLPGVVYSAEQTAVIRDGGVVSAEAGRYEPAEADVMPSVLVPSQPWEVAVGDSLRETLERWCQRVGYRLVWNIEGGYRAQGEFSVGGDFKQAVAALFAAIPQDLHLRVDISKNKLVVISRSGQ